MFRKKNIVKKTALVATAGVMLLGAMPFTTMANEYTTIEIEATMATSIFIREPRTFIQTAPAFINFSGIINGVAHVGVLHPNLNTVVINSNGSFTVQYEGQVVPVGPVLPGTIIIDQEYLNLEGVELIDSNETINILELVR